ncbi:hypothetical protein FRC11_003581, partial [Ceratobasidium sp. 423]
QSILAPVHISLEHANLAQITTETPNEGAVVDKDLRVGDHRAVYGKLRHALSTLEKTAARLCPPLQVPIEALLSGLDTLQVTSPEAFRWVIIEQIGCNDQAASSRRQDCNALVVELEANIVILEKHLRETGSLNLTHCVTNIL